MKLEFDRLTKRYGENTVIDDITATLDFPHVLALLGPSGGGKSTLLRLIGGLESPEGGSLTVDHEPVPVTGKSLRTYRSNIGTVFQSWNLFPHLDALANIMLPLTAVHGLPPDEARVRSEELLERLHLNGHASKRPAELSGGQRQRMALARALAVDPQVLLLDEPFGALDAKVREDLRSWLRRLHDEVHVTTVLVTHDQSEALDVADRIAVLNKGRIEQVGTPTQVYDSPANPFVMSFLGTVSSLNGILVRPHDIRVGRTPEMAIAAGDGTAESTGVTRATIDRVVYLGFEVRVELTSATTGDPFIAQITRGDAEALGLNDRDTVYVRATRIPPIAGVEQVAPSEGTP
jgi:sulfate transport system ATP-binding protein